MIATAAREAGSAVVAEWLIREQQWKRDPEHRVVVVFADETADQALH
ncbi:MAG: hypothetical protein IPM30_14915 [Burkholderiales bacterium]|nr:hypothetical protein [Burkholderiales bacterium]